MNSWIVGTCMNRGTDKIGFTKNLLVLHVVWVLDYHHILSNNKIDSERERERVCLS